MGLEMFTETSVNSGRASTEALPAEDKSDGMKKS